MFKIAFLCAYVVGAFTCTALAAAVFAPTLSLPLLNAPLAFPPPITAVSSQFIQRNYHTALPLPLAPLIAAPAAAFTPAAPPLVAAPWSARFVQPAAGPAVIAPIFADATFGAALIAPARATPLRRFVARYSAPAALLTVRRYPAARQRVYRYASYY